MKLISKFKDYYDYLQGIYGVDEKLVYDRRTKYFEKQEKYVKDTINPPKVEGIVFSICGKRYQVYSFEGKNYHTVDDLLKLDSILKKTKVDVTFLEALYWQREKNLRKLAEEKFKSENIKTTLNKEFRQPVLVKVHFKDGFEYKAKDGDGRYKHYNRRVDSTWRLPDLSSYGFAKWYPAEEMYQMISTFMGWMVDNPEIPNKQTNNEKLEAHGFDKKISFRHRKN